ncbi:MAG: hypothetical protein ACOYOB_18825 [Myxococcota bacterium]
MDWSRSETERRDILAWLDEARRLISDDRLSPRKAAALLADAGGLLRERLEHCTGGAAPTPGIDDPTPLGFRLPKRDIGWPGWGWVPPPKVQNEAIGRIPQPACQPAPVRDDVGVRA